jgi:hypothetical protein
MDYQDSKNTHVSGNDNELLQQLYRVTPGRLHATTQELGRLTGHADQTIRKAHSQTGEFLGLRPIKIGNRLLWSLAEIAVLLSDAGSNKEVQNYRGGRSATRPRKTPTVTGYDSGPITPTDLTEGRHD